MQKCTLSEIDIRKFFDTIDRERLREILRHRVLDGVLLRLIDKWLKAGVLEDGMVMYPKAGSPQGGVVSPLLANVFLHEVLDLWFERDVKPHLRGKALLVRYADDAVLLFEREHDARRVMAVLPKRFGKYGLRLHPEKTRLIELVRPDKRAMRVGGNPPPRPTTFDFLGFTHFWGKSRKGKWLLQRLTAKDRFRRALKHMAYWCQTHRHDPVRAQHQALTRKLRGHYGYYGIIGNFRALKRFRQRVICVWRKWLNRRSQRARVHWERMNKLLERYPLPQPRMARPVHARAANR